jgi:hypothetical protein
MLLNNVKQRIESNRKVFLSGEKINEKERDLFK